MLEIDNLIMESLMLRHMHGLSDEQMSYFVTLNIFHIFSRSGCYQIDDASDRPYCLCKMSAAA